MGEVIWPFRGGTATCRYMFVAGSRRHSDALPAGRHADQELWSVSVLIALRSAAVPPQTPCSSAAGLTSQACVSTVSTAPPRRPARLAILAIAHSGGTGRFIARRARRIAPTRQAAG